MTLQSVFAKIWGSNSRTNSALSAWQISTILKVDRKEAASVVRQLCKAGLIHQDGTSISMTAKGNPTQATAYRASK